MKLDINIPVRRNERPNVEHQGMVGLFCSFNKLDFGNLSTCASISGRELDKGFSVQKVGTEVGVSSAGKGNEWDRRVQAITTSPNKSASDIEIITRLYLKVPLNSSQFNFISDSLIVSSSNSNCIELDLI